MDKNEDGGATNWVEGTQYPHGISGAESEDVLAFANDHGRLGERERERCSTGVENRAGKVEHVGNIFRAW